MVNAFLEVLKDLWLFVFGNMNHNEVSVIPVPVVESPVEKPVITSTEIKSDTLVSKTKANTTNDFSMAAGQKAYIKIDNTPCLQKPIFSFDIQVGRLKYGEEVIIDDIGKDFVHVQALHFSGWVESSSITEDKRVVLPTFQSGYVYGDNNEHTKKLRQYICDESLGGELNLSLRPEEFILFRLKQKAVKIRWSHVRPRLAGDWKTILRGVRGVSISLQPHTGSVLEMVDDSNAGFLAMVEEVKPDNSIKIVGVGREREGEYREEILTNSQWIEWRPVFITLT